MKEIYRDCKTLGSALGFKATVIMQVMMMSFLSSELVANITI